MITKKEGDQSFVQFDWGRSMSIWLIQCNRSFKSFSLALFMRRLFGVRSIMFMVVLTIAILVLPLILPPLPPPPMILMLVPAVIMLLLVMLAVSSKHCPEVIHLCNFTWQLPIPMPFSICSLTLSRHASLFLVHFLLHACFVITHQCVSSEQSLLFMFISFISRPLTQKSEQCDNFIQKEHSIWFHNIIQSCMYLHTCMWVYRVVVSFSI